VKNATGWVALLPYFDQAPLFNTINPASPMGMWNPGGGMIPNGGMIAPANATATGTKISLLLCPSDDGPQTYPGFDGTYGCAPGIPSYRTSYGFSVTQPHPWDNSTGYTWNSENRSARAMFGAMSNANFRDVRDGLSNTVAVAETTLDVYDGVAQSWACSQHVGGGINFANSPAGRINNWFCCAWASPPNQQYRIGRLGEWGSPGSLHTGGMHVTMGDGAVRFISENINTTTQQRLGYIADGETIGEF
jgi:hypothetical protein